MLNLFIMVKPLDVGKWEDGAAQLRAFISAICLLLGELTREEVKKMERGFHSSKPGFQI